MDNNQLLKEFHLGIAGFRIVFNFRLENKSYSQAISSIMRYFMPFVIEKKVDTINYTVEFISRDIHRAADNTQSIIIKNDTYIKLCSSDVSKKVLTVLFPVGIYGIELVLRMIFFELLPRTHSFCIHASAVISPSGGAYLFLGNSGAGKSTIIHMIGKSFKPLFDDIGFIKKRGSEYYLYVSPYKEKNTYEKTPKSFLIEKIFFPVKSKHFLIQRQFMKDIPSGIKRISNQILVNTSYSGPHYQHINTAGLRL